MWTLQDFDTAIDQSNSRIAFSCGLKSISQAIILAIVQSGYIQCSLIGHSSGAEKYV